MVNVIEYLIQNNIQYVIHEHKAVFTTKEADEIKDIPGLACKNLFLKSKKADSYFLVIIPASEKMDLKGFGEKINEKKLTFGSKEDMLKLLGVEPGSVSPFGLLNDKDYLINVYISKIVYDAEIVGFHPNRNTATVELTKEMFHKYLSKLSNPIHTF
ncbi:MAG: YbaK/EbsC family protein [bacterium]